MCHVCHITEVLLAVPNSHTLRHGKKPACYPICYTHLCNSQLTPVGTFLKGHVKSSSLTVPKDLKNLIVVARFLLEKTNFLACIHETGFLVNFFTCTYM